MAKVTYSHRLDLAAIKALVNSPNGGVAKDLIRRGVLVETQAKRNLGGIGGPQRVDSGRLRSSIGPPQVITRNGQLAVLVGTNVFYAMFVHDGTGIYGPKGKPIRPTRRKLLKFRPKGSRRWVYARQVKGMMPNRFLLNALPAARG